MPVEVIYTDGCCLNNGTSYAQGGVGVFFGDGDHCNISAPLEGNVQTNNRAELTAVILAVCHGTNGYNLHIKTDSKYVHEGTTCINRRVKGWRANDWYNNHGGQVKNQDLFQDLVDNIEEYDGRVKIIHVKGHRGEYGNEQADRLARQGAQK